ncbi:glycosyltransferase family 2 protein [Patescibacteria group bacterium]|nr:glycosyltransferase family 2 protein [Patescibacteria group bacterium]MBP9709457.1 glycosyltransferase family 2 protein [Patescibacteria group bacterium]
MSSPLASIHFAISHPAGSIIPTLQSLGAQTWQQFQVVLVDNASQDIEIPWERGVGPEVMMLRNFRDQGFSRAHNQALSSLFARWEPSTWQDRYIVLASSRVLFAPDAIQQMIQALEQDSALMVVAPKVRQASLHANEDSDEPILKDNGIIEQVGLKLGHGLVLTPRGRGEKDTGQYDSQPPELLGNWCLVMRASALMQAKMGEEWLDADLPEAYAMADVAWRLRTLQFPIQLVPQALVWVQRAQTPPSGIIARIKQWYGQEALQERKSYSYACVLRGKNAAWSSLIVAMPWLWFAWLKRLFVTLADLRILPAIMKSWLVLPRALHKRKFLSLAIQQAQRGKS